MGKVQQQVVAHRSKLEQAVRHIQATANEVQDSPKKPSNIQRVLDVIRQSPSRPICWR